MKVPFGFQQNVRNQIKQLKKTKASFKLSLIRTVKIQRKVNKKN